MKHPIYLILLLAFLASNFGAFSQQVDYTFVDFPVVDFVYSESEDKIYVVVSRSAERLSRSLVRVDPNTGLAEDSLSMEFDPSMMRITESGNYIYVAFSDRGQISRINPSTWEVDQEIELGPLPFTNPSAWAMDFVVMNGSDNRLVVARMRESENFHDLVMYENGILQGQAITSGSQTELCASPDGSMVFAYNSVSTGHQCYQISVSSNGLSLLGTYEDLVDGFRDIKASGKYVLSGSGSFIDAFVTPPVVKGNFYLGFHGEKAQGYLMSEYSGRALFITDDLELSAVRPSLYAFDTNTLARLDERLEFDFSGTPANGARSAADLVQISADRYAALFSSTSSSSSHLVIFDTPPLSVEDAPVEQESMSLYPNPVKDNLFIHLSDCRGCDAQILNAQGAIVSKLIVKNDEAIDVSQLIPGTYTIIIDKVVSSFVKQ